MRATATGILVGALALACPAAADPGHGPLRVEIARFAYSPADLTIVQGDLVVWEWAGPDTNHSVTSDDGQAFAFDSDPGGAPAHEVGARYAVTFDQAGAFTYHCRVHPLMTGKVTVTPAAAPAVPAPPRVSDVRAAASGRRLVVRYALNDDARLRAQIRRAGGGAVLRRAEWAAPPGAGTRRIKLAGIKPGRYTLTLVPLDRSTGAPAKAVRRTFTIR